MADTEPTPLAQALGRVPTGLYIVTTLDGDTPVGFVGSFVMQNGLEPPVLSVAVGKARGPLEALRVIHSFDPCLSCAVHIMRPGSKPKVVWAGGS